MDFSGPASDLLRDGVVLIGAGGLFVCLGLRRPGGPEASEPSGVGRLFARALPRRAALARRLAAAYPALAGAVGLLVGVGFVAAALGAATHRG